MWRVDTSYQLRGESYAYMSALARGAWNVGYVMGQRVDAPRNTRLLAFDTYQHAHDFFRDFQARGFCVVACETDEARPEQWLCKWSRPHEFAAFWAGRPEHTTPAPVGTVSCAWLIPQEVVDVA